MSVLPPFGNHATILIERGLVGAEPGFTSVHLAEIGGQSR